jgi:hypothetical protein
MTEWPGQEVKPRSAEAWPGQEVARPEGTKEKDTSLTGMLGAYGRGVVNAFGTADEMRAGTDALAQGARAEPVRWRSNGPSMGEAYDQSLAANRAQLDADREQHPVASTAGQIAGGVGASLYAAPVAAAARLPALAAPVLSRVNPLLQGLPGFAQTAGRVVGGGAAVAAGRASQKARADLTSGSARRRSGRAVGAGVGTLAHGALAAGNKILNPVRVNLSPEAQRIRGVARAGGVQTSVAQETGSPYLKNIEASLAKLPGSAGMEANAQRIQNEAFTRHGMRFAGENVTDATPATLNASAARSGGEIGRIASSYNLDASPPQFLNDLVAAADKARGFAATDVEKQTLARINSVVDKVQAGDIIPGQTYRELRSEIGETMRSYAGRRPAAASARRHEHAGRCLRQQHSARREGSVRQGAARVRQPARYRRCDGRRWRGNCPRPTLAAAPG